MTTPCEKCGRELEVGDFPFCPHGRSSHAIQTNESFIGGVTIENMGHEPVTVYSREEYKAQMAAHGCEQRIKHVPGDKYLKSWDVPSAYTLECARILLSRGASAPEPDPAALPSLRMGWRNLTREDL